MRQKIDYSDFKSLRILAMKYAKQRGVWDKEIAEDFAQEYCLAVWLGKYRSLSFQLVNFLRSYYGRTDKYGSLQDRAKSFALRTMRSYNEEDNKTHRTGAS